MPSLGRTGKREHLVRPHVASEHDQFVLLLLDLDVHRCGAKITQGEQRESAFEHALAAAETITGLIVATTPVYPDKKLASVKPKSIVKRMKEKHFARSASRESIRECEAIGIPLPEFAELSLMAMREISDELGL